VGAALAEHAGRWRRAFDLVLPTASAQLTALPLLLARLHVVSWVAPLANLLAVPVSGLLLAGAWLAATWELALPGTARWAFAACEALASALRTITDAGAALPEAAWATGADAAAPAIAAFGAALLVLGLTMPRTTHARARPPAWRTPCAVIGLACTIAALACAATTPPLLPAPGHAWLVTLDVGQGDALALATPHGWWLVDAGPHTPHTDAGERFVLPFLRWAGVRSLSGLVLTHDDADHTGGAAAVLRALPVGVRLAPPPRADAPGPGARYSARPVARGDTLERAPRLCVLWPPPGVRAARGWSDNHAAVVLELACDTTRALLLADVDSTAERLITPPHSVVLKIAHHGSRSSTGSELLAHARPQLAVISCGRGNHFGHPHPEVLERLRAAGVRIRRTDLAGAVWLDLDATGVREVDWRHDAHHLRRVAPERARPAAPRE
jgi:competence protein ComEC